jgi:hypothetical protein
MGVSFISYGTGRSVSLYALPRASEEGGTTLIGSLMH